MAARAQKTAIGTANERETLSARAADDISRRVATLELPPGETFTEQAIADRLGMGRVPVREALLRLASTGLLIPRTGSGYTVAPITLRTARDVLDAWRLIEPAAVELALARGTAERIAKELRGLTDVPEDWALAEFQFHLGITIAGTNMHLVRGHPGLEVTRLLKLAEQLGEPAPGCGKKAHNRLLTALAKQDPVAPEIARDTIAAVQRRVLDVLLEADSLHAINLGES